MKNAKGNKEQLFASKGGNFVGNSLKTYIKQTRKSLVRV